MSGSVAIRGGCVESVPLHLRPLDVTGQQRDPTLEDAEAGTPRGLVAALVQELQPHTDPEERAPPLDCLLGCGPGDAGQARGLQGLDTAAEGTHPG